MRRKDMKYSVYRNLHNGKLSIKSGKTGLVVGHADAVEVFLANFRVSKAGVMKIRERRQKAVVATVHGGISNMVGFTSYKGRNVSECYPHLTGGEITPVAFNPYKYTSFVHAETEESVSKAERVSINNTGKMKAWGVK